MKKLLILAGVFLLIVGLVSTSSAVPLVNGDFDDTSDIFLADGGWAVYDSIAGWTASDGTSGIEIQYNTIVVAHSPDFYVELDSHGDENTNSSMYQTVTLDAGSYELSFWYHARTNNSGDDNGIRASIGNQSENQFIDVSKMTDEQSNVWEEIIWNFTIEDEGDFDLMFAAFGNDNTLGGFIDSVSLNAAPVPEPASMLLLGTGLLGLAGLGRKKFFKK